MEEWKDIEGYEGLYQVSNHGRVKSLKFGKEKILKALVNGRGYYHVCLSKNNIQKTIIIHRLVALAFIPNPQNKPQINHKNGIKTDNYIDNLEWVSHQENMQHAYDTGLNKNKGEKHYKSKLTEEEVLEIRASNLTQKELTKRYNISQSFISLIKNKNKHGNNN